MATANRHRRIAGAALVALAAALVAAGCGDDGDDGAPAKATDEVEIRQVTKPTADEELTKDLGSDGEALTAAGCTFGTFDEHEATHVEEGDALDDDEFPSTSGRHFGDWAPFGVYDEPIEDGYVIHNLEHGGVVVWLGTKVDDASAAAIEKLPEDEEKWIVAPRRDIEGLFSAAWAKGLECSPEALAKLEPDVLADGIEAWFEAVVSTGSEAEKELPAFAGAMKEPSPERDISTESTF